MSLIDLSKITFSYNKDSKTFTISERDVPFCTEYEVKNPSTGAVSVFEFKHSTGPEYNKDTKWIYANKEGIILEVCNDPIMVKEAARLYIEAKTRK